MGPRSVRPIVGIPVEVPGLDVLLPEIASGRIVIVESGLDGAKSFFVRRLAQTAAARGAPVTFLVSRDRDEVLRELSGPGFSPTNGVGGVEVREEDSLKKLGESAERGGVLAVDSFSFMSLE